MSGTPIVEPTIAGLRSAVAGWRGAGLKVGLVPTMGALHDGHMALVEAARAASDRVVVSIFVNPTQFSPSEDFDAYPRPAEADLARLRDAGVELAFMPPAAEMYPDGFATTVSVAGLTECLCGISRPMHFKGVATIVAKLLLQCLPDGAWFGEKDFQQLQVIRRLTRDLDIPVAIHGVPTVREADGTALSSRNAYLTAAQRRCAPALVGALKAVAAQVAGGTAAAEASALGRRRLAEAGFDRIDYLEVREEETLALVADRPRPGSPVRVFGAAFLGETRLIDNWPVG